MRCSRTLALPLPLLPPPLPPGAGTASPRPVRSPLLPAARLPVPALSVPLPTGTRPPSNPEPSSSCANIPWRESANHSPIYPPLSLCYRCATPTSPQTASANWGGCNPERPAKLHKHSIQMLHPRKSRLRKRDLASRLY
ncbi:hypothetical protein XENTR_v10014966 [Xenopus tropicalis]|nr:hypothetical protein XENTR_v10014966 [Xenopus tropicalis]